MTNINRKNPRAPAMTVLAMAAALALPATVVAADPYGKPDESWISLNGKVKSVSPDRFALDYGEGSIMVEMDDGDRDADAYQLLPGDKVAVTGRIDDDLFESRTIEASSVHVKNLNTTFYSSAVDEEAAWMVYYPTVTMDAAYNVVGTVSKVDEDGETFVVDTGPRMLRVDVGDLGYNPLDDDGYQKVEVGDRVSVTGDIDYDLFEGRELEASSIIGLGQRGSS